MTTTVWLLESRRTGYSEAFCVGIFTDLDKACAAARKAESDHIDWDHHSDSFVSARTEKNRWEACEWQLDEYVEVER